VAVLLGDIEMGDHADAAGACGEEEEVVLSEAGLEFWSGEGGGRGEFEEEDVGGRAVGLAGVGGDVGDT